ncbi:MAG: GNAT family N-acetyltransferase [Planctomycetota bacterium]
MDEKPIADPSNIREMNLETDLDRVCEIWLIGSLTSHGFIPAGFWYSLLADVKKEFATKDGDKKHYEIYVYKEKDGIIKGFIIVKCKNQAGKIKNYVEELFVDLPYQRKGTDTEKGIGTQLLEHVKKDKTFLETTVYQLNTGAIIFYAKQGFEIKKGQDSIYVENKTGQWKLWMRWKKDSN